MTLLPLKADPSCHGSRDNPISQGARAKSCHRQPTAWALGSGFASAPWLKGICAAMLFFVALGNPTHVLGQDWMTRGSYYTHNPKTKKRVNQYAPEPNVVHTPNPYKRVFRYSRSRLQVDGSFENYHTVEAFGGVVRPYGEWQRPFRPYSVPYSDWAYGSPFGYLAYPRRTNPSLPPGVYGPSFFPYQPFGIPSGLPGTPGVGFPGTTGLPSGSGVPFVGPRPFP